jgi:hypothetical protein
MLNIETPIKAAWLVSVRSQSCETFEKKVGHNLPKWREMSGDQKPRTESPSYLYRCGGFFIFGEKRHVRNNLIKQRLLCSEQTAGNRGTQSFGATGDQDNLVTNVSRAARGHFTGGLLN